MGLQYLTKLYNLSYNNADIPAIWKLAIVIPLLKPGKPASTGSGYRPISLLCPAAKVLERLLLPELNTLPLAQSQHGFRKEHSTTTALLPLTQQIAWGFNQPLPPQRTVTMSIDFSKAFDMVSPIKLISALSQTSLSFNTIRWLSAYLRGRMTKCRYNYTDSPQRHIRTGVPQGSCISPILFNFFVSTYPQSDVLTTSYADDFTDSCSSSSIPTAARHLSMHAERVGEWADERGLAISAPKSNVTLFTPDLRQSRNHPTVHLNNSPLPLERNPRILGVKLDPHFTFSPHIDAIIKRIAPRINILKALTGTNWGQEKETLLITFKSLIRSLWTYAAPIWYPNASNTAINKLQIQQNKALRIATGCVKMSSISHLHAESKVLPIKDHLTLLCSQFLTKSLQPSHPSYSTVTAPSGPRDKKQTLQSKFLNVVAPYLSNGIILPQNCSATIKSLHTDAVTRAINLSDRNPLLNDLPPPIAEEETTLPRHCRTTLSQLRSGYCSSLAAYRERIGMSTDPLCPSCREEPQTVPHLFSCREHPTDLRAVDLWDRPCLVSDFLSGLPFFNLPPHPRPPPEPPPPSSPLLDSS